MTLLIVQLRIINGFQVLLKASVSQGSEGWSDSRFIEALETSPSMVHRVRKQLVEEGIEAVLSRGRRRRLRGF